MMSTVWLSGGVTWRVRCVGRVLRGVVAVSVLALTSGCSAPIELNDPAVALVGLQDLPPGQWVQHRSGVVGPDELGTTAFGFGAGSRTCVGEASDLPTPTRGAAASFTSEQSGTRVVHVVLVMTTSDDAARAVSDLRSALSCDTIEDLDGAVYDVESVDLDALPEPHVAAITHVSNVDAAAGGTRIMAGDTAVAGWHRDHVVVLLLMNTALAGLNRAHFEQLVSVAVDRINDAA